MVYDSLLIFAMLMLVASPLVIWNGGPMRDGNAWGEIKNMAFFIYLFGWVCLFYGWCWTLGGQTLGMSAWKIRVTDIHGQTVSWQQAMIRCLSAGLGLSNLTALFYRDRRGWHERLSGTRTVRIPVQRKT
jgi:uncharacterized RDD family membrane protein YckC